MARVHNCASTSDIECPICYDNPEFMKMLNCKHSFCLNCLTKLTNVSYKFGAVECPTCRRKTPLNYNDIGREIQLLPTRFFRPIQCLNCSEAKLCIDFWYCATCPALLCSKCMVKKLSEHLDHKLSEWDDGVAVEHAKSLVRQAAQKSLSTLNKNMEKIEKAVNDAVSFAMLKTENQLKELENLQKSLQSFYGGLNSASTLPKNRPKINGRQFSLLLTTALDIAKIALPDLVNYMYILQSEVASIKLNPREFSQLLWSESKFEPSDETMKPISDERELDSWHAKVAPWTNKYNEVLSIPWHNKKELGEDAVQFVLLNTVVACIFTERIMFYNTSTKTQVIQKAEPKTVYNGGIACRHMQQFIVLSCKTTKMELTWFDQAGNRLKDVEFCPPSEDMLRNKDYTLIYFSDDVLYLYQQCDGPNPKVAFYRLEQTDSPLKITSIEVFSFSYVWKFRASGVINGEKIIIFYAPETDKICIRAIDGWTFITPFNGRKVKYLATDNYGVIWSFSNGWIKSLEMWQRNIGFPECKHTISKKLDYDPSKLFTDSNGVAIGAFYINATEEMHFVPLRNLIYICNSQHE